MSDLQRQLRVINEHNSDGTHNAKAATTLKTLLPASATPAANTIPISDGSGKLDGWVTVALTKSFESAEQTLVLSTTISVAHGLGVKPKLSQASIICKTAELGFSVGDEVSFEDWDGVSAIMTIGTNSSNIWSSISAGNPVVVRKDTQAHNTITLANWKLILRAWA